MEYLYQSHVMLVECEENSNLQKSDWRIVIIENVASVMMTDLWIFHKTYDERECDALLDFVVVLIGVIVTYMRCVEEYKFVMVEVFAQ